MFFNIHHLGSIRGASQLVIFERQLRARTHTCADCGVNYQSSGESCNAAVKKGSLFESKVIFRFSCSYLMPQGSENVSNLFKPRPIPWYDWPPMLIDKASSRKRSSESTLIFGASYSYALAPTLDRACVTLGMRPSR